MSKDHIQDYWNWVGNIIFLPVLTALAIWACLSIAKENSFSLSFGSGDLISVSTMMFIVLYQEISNTPMDKRSPFNKFLHGSSMGIISALWLIYGIIKYHSQTASDTDITFPISIGSLIFLVSMSAMCMIQKYKLK